MTTMRDLRCYKTLPEWTAETLPAGFRQPHNTKAGTWAKLKVFSGQLKFYALDESGDITAEHVFGAESDTPFIEPQAWHRVAPISDDLHCQLSFYCAADDFYVKKYGLTATHSEVREAMTHIKHGTALDLGCGRGRNALFLQQQGFDVTGFDQNAEAINKLQAIIEQEQLGQIRAFTGDANAADIDGQFDLIVCTVVMMFLDPLRIPDIIANMQASTNPGGIHVIVCAMDTEDYPLPRDFMSFGFRPSELSNYYADWTLKKYNEDPGHLHKKDANGNPMPLRFATLIAQKPRN